MSDSDSAVAVVAGPVGDELVTVQQLVIPDDSSDDETTVSTVSEVIEHGKFYHLDIDAQTVLYDRHTNSKSWPNSRVITLQSTMSDPEPSIEFNPYPHDTFVLYPNSDCRDLYLDGNSDLDFKESGVDIPCPNDVFMIPGETLKIPLGVRAVCLRNWFETTNDLSNKIRGAPWGYYLEPRSSISKKTLFMVNSHGIIDMTYRGELMAVVHNYGVKPLHIERGKAYFQLTASDLRPVLFETIKDDNDPRVAKYFADGVTTRGSGGFGSTGDRGNMS